MWSPVYDKGSKTELFVSLELMFDIKKNHGNNYKKLQIYLTLNYTAMPKYY